MRTVVSSGEHFKFKDVHIYLNKAQHSADPLGPVRVCLCVCERETESSPEI